MLVWVSASSKPCGGTFCCGHIPSFSFLLWGALLVCSIDFCAKLCVNLLVLVAVLCHS